MQRRMLAALLAVFLLLGPVPSTSAVGSASKAENTLTAILLVAQDPVADPNFGGSIVVVMNNLGPGPVGIIINRPMPLKVSRIFPKIKRLAQAHDKVYFGGPVEFGEVWYLFQAKTAPAKSVRVCAGVYVSSDSKLLLKLLGREKPMQGLRIFLGHAGWAPGQLQAEIEGGAWRPRRASADSIFNPRSQLPWPARKGAKGGSSD